MPSARYYEVISELVNDLPTQALTKSEKLAKVAEAKAEFEAELTAQQEANETITVKPDYANLLELYNRESDPDVKQALQEEAYKFTSPLTLEEQSLFSYLPLDYLEDNPGYNDQGEYVSYIGSFPNPETGEYT